MEYKDAAQGAVQCVGRNLLQPGKDKPEEDAVNAGMHESKASSNAPPGPFHGQQVQQRTHTHVN